MHRSRFRSLWVGGRSLLCSRGSPMWLGTRWEPSRAGAKPGGVGRGGGPFAAGVGSWWVKGRTYTPTLLMRSKEIYKKYFSEQL